MDSLHSVNDVMQGYSRQARSSIDANSSCHFSLTGRMRDCATCEQTHGEVMTAMCVFCGSASGSRPIYTQAARELGAHLARRKITLVYGAANCGLMAAVADAVLSAGGEVEGVIPEVIDRMDLTHLALTRLHKVGTMHQRKALMADLAHGFIAMPGGIGTLDELCEILCWAQLDLHRKPIGLLNIDGYFDGLLKFLHHAVSEGFVRPLDVERLIIEREPAALLDRLASSFT
jgi:uncharacterized protein (TIGR00730 family)